MYTYIEISFCFLRLLGSLVRKNSIRSCMCSAPKVEPA